MDFFRQGYNAIRGPQGQPQSVDETIEKLADCLETATLLEDRRAGVLSLKGLVRDYPQNVGDGAFPGLVKVLHMDYADADITKSLLETFASLCTVNQPNSAEDIGYKYSDLFLKDTKNVTIVLDILEEFDFYVRYNAIKLLATLAANRMGGIQQCILTSPMGITRLVDLLNDRRDIIRNESLLLLTTLTQTNSEIQKLVAFQGVFEKLLGVIEEEEGISGGIIVQDSLALMHNLLRYNVSNQIYFRETSCMQEIPGLLGYVGDSDADHVPYSYEDWPPQKLANTVLVLELIRILTEPDGANTGVNQKFLAQSGILLPVIQLGICSNAPPVVRTEAIYALAFVIRANAINQDLFAKAVVASPPRMIDGQIDPEAPVGLPRPALVSLIALAVSADPDAHYSYGSRAAAAYAVCACVEENNDAQVVLASMLKTPPSDNINSNFADKPFSAGSLLLDAVQNWELSVKDPYKVWFACAILSHVIRGNEQAKQMAGAIEFGEEANGEEPVPLLHHIVAQLLMSLKVSTTNSRIPIAYLCLLCTWLYDSPSSVSLFLGESTHIQFLIQEIQSSANDPIVQGLAAFLLGITYEYNNDPHTPLDREKLQAILSSRVDLFTSVLARLRDSPALKNAGEYFQISTVDESVSSTTGSLPSLIIDNTFAEFFKDTYEHIQRSMKRKPSSYQKKQEVATPAGPESEQEIQNYRTTIQQQADELKQLREKVGQLESAMTALKTEDEKVRDQLKETEQERNSLKEQLQSAQTSQEELKKELAEAHTQQETLRNQVKEAEAGRAAAQESLSTLEKEQEDLLVCMGEQDLDIKKYRKRLRDHGEQVTDSEEEEEEE
ncbi:p115 like vesicle tethering protein [Syncephalastrum racemosum]|uniref:p115 like vesicle tethering protein n=1 Tax=Syncephalastrum racemosum TaxID=13706 RepID=A0A1X2H649_SYNRA|nr:p115 like vesicle tethering protein [Syncephalastrum racemosum]